LQSELRRKYDGDGWDPIRSVSAATQSLKKTAARANVGQRCVTGRFCNARESRWAVRSSSRPAIRMRADAAVRMNVGQRCVTARFCNSNESRTSVRSSGRPARRMRAVAAAGMKVR
jgi:hypothetical protein